MEKSISNFIFSWLKEKGIIFVGQIGKYRNIK